jgi:hypothetical protein
MYKRVKTGLVLFLDDDDFWLNPEFLTEIVKKYKSGNELIFWKVKIKDRIIPSTKNFGKAPVLCDISGGGFAFCSKYLKYAGWEGYKRGDYRVATKLYNKIKKSIWINKVHYEAQDGANCGMNYDIITKKSEINDKIMEQFIKVEIINIHFMGRVLDYKVGDVKELPLSVARQLIMHKLAKIYSIVPDKVEKVIEPEKIEKVVKPKKVKK